MIQIQLCFSFDLNTLLRHKCFYHPFFSHDSKLPDVIPCFPMFSLCSYIFQCFFFQFFFFAEVLKAFSDDSSFSYGLLELHCSELAEDLLDHALWRVFSAAGEDHRGVLGAAELEKALQQESGSSGADRAGGEAPGPFGALDGLGPWIFPWQFDGIPMDSMAMDR